MMKRVSIILINYNSWKDTIECINSINESTYKLYNIIVVDNCSTDDSCEKIESYLNGSRYEINNNYYKNNLKFSICEYLNGEFLKTFEEETKNSIVFIKNKKNDGFSKGNNIRNKIF